MLNQLRSDIYRLRRTHFLLIPFEFSIGLFAVILAIGIASGIAEAETVEEWVFGESPLEMTAIVGMSTMLLPLVVTWPTISLICGDRAAGGFKSVISTRGARKSYLGSKIALSAGYALAAPAVLFACFLVIPTILGLPYRAWDAPLDTVLWIVLAAIVCFAFSVVAIFASMFVKGEAATWVVAFLAASANIDGILSNILVVVADLVPSFEGVAMGLTRLLLSSQASCVAGSPSLVPTELPLGTLALVVGASLAWTIAAGAGSFALFRKKIL